MDFGMPTLVTLDSLAENARLCRALGLSFVEINMNLPMYGVEKLERLDLSPRDGVYYTLHLDENLNPFDFNPWVAEAYAKTAEAALRLAARNGVPVVNMHMPQGVHFKLPGRKVYLFETYYDKFIRDVKAFRARAEAAAGSAAVCVENTTFSGFSRLHDALDELLLSDSFALTYDAGHDACDGFRAKAYYEARKDRLKHMHLHQSDKKTCHLPLGEGAVDLEARLQSALCAGARAVVEVKDEKGLRDSVKWLRERANIS